MREDRRIAPLPRLIRLLEFRVFPPPFAWLRNLCTDAEMNKASFNFFKLVGLLVSLSVGPAVTLLLL